MSRNLKVLGLALFAVFAMSAMTAASASAVTITTTSGAEIHADDTGNVKFTVTGQTITCSTGTFKGTAPAAQFSTLTVNATYNGCKTALGTTATIDGFGPGECDYVLHSDTGLSDLVCAAGKDVTVTAGPCVVHIPGQNGLGTITYTTDETGPKKALELHLNVTGITGTHTDGVFCPFGSSGHNAGGILEGSITAKAFTNGGATQVDLTDH